MHTDYTAPRSHHVFAIALAFAMTFASASVFAGGLFGDSVKGNGIVKKQDRTVAHFTAIELTLPAQVEVRIGATEGVTVETDENLLPYVQTTVEDGTLRLRTPRRGTDLDTQTLKIVVTAKSIAALGVGGSGSISADTLRSPRLHMGVGGSGSIDIKSLQSDAVETSVGGSGSVKLGGSARKLSITIGGSGDVQARQLKADDASVSIGGSGSVSLWAVNTLQASIAGSGDVTYYGDAKTTTSVVGSGRVKRLGASPQ